MNNQFEHFEQIEHQTIKVLMPALHYYPVIGGIETWTKNIAEGLSKKAEIFIVTGKINGQPKEEELSGVKIWRTSLFTLTNLSASPLIYTFSLLPFIFFKSLNLIKKEKIDILHCQGFLSSFLGFLLSKITGISYLVTVQRQERKGNFLKEMVYRKASVCIGASWAIGKYFKEIGCKSKKIKVIPNGIDLKRFKGLEPKTHAGFLVITVARLEKVKGIEYLIEAASRSDLLGRSDILILIIGDGSQRKNLENLVKKLNLQEKVKFLGQIPNEEIPKYLAQADCFVLPSIKEGFGIAILEAMAAGLPVIGTRVGGIMDIIEDQKTGILVEPENPRAIANAIQEIYSGRKFTRPNLEKYDWQNIAEKVYEIYNRCRNISS